MLQTFQYSHLSCEKTSDVTPRCNREPETHGNFQRLKPIPQIRAAWSMKKRPSVTRLYLSISEENSSNAYNT